MNYTASAALCAQASLYTEVLLFDDNSVMRLFILMVLPVGALANPGGRVFIEAGGLVSMEAENASYMKHWKPIAGTSGSAMEADQVGVRNGGVLRFDVEFTAPGAYAVWVLGRKGAHSQYGANDVKVWADRDLSRTVSPDLQSRALDRPITLRDGRGHPSFTDKKPQSEIGFGQSEAFSWVGKLKEAEGPAIWRVENPGRHHIEFVVGEEYGFGIDKVVLTLDHKQTLSDSGPPESATR